MPAGQAWIDKFVKLYNHQIPAGSWATYTGIMAWANAVTAVGDAYNFKAVNTYLRENGYEGHQGLIKWDKDNVLRAQKAAPVVHYQVQDGELIDHLHRSAHSRLIRTQIHRSALDKVNVANHCFIKTNFDLCTGCCLCQLACSMRLLGGYNPHRALLKIEHAGENLYHFPTVCNQCANPYCASVCPVQAIRRDPATGAMVVDHEHMCGLQSVPSLLPHRRGGRGRGIEKVGQVRPVRRCPPLRGRLSDGCPGTGRWGGGEPWLTAPWDNSWWLT